MYQIILTLGGTILLALFFGRFYKAKSNLPYPPGPKGYPILGSLFEMPIYCPWLVYDKWLEKYDGWVFFKVLGQPVLILGDLLKTTDLFETRSSIYSSRMESTMISELMNGSYVFALQPYGPRWRRQRRLFHKYFHPNTVLKYQARQMKGAHSLLLRLLETPDKLKETIFYAFTSTIVDIVYGKELVKENDPYMENLEVSTKVLIEAAIPGQFLVDLVPPLKYIPSWVPGAGFKRKAAICKDANVKLLEDPWSESRLKLRINELKDCMAKDVMNDLSLSAFNPDEELLAKETCATAAMAGSDTTLSSMQTFFLAMALYPETLKKAQMELDSVVGRARLPTFEDRHELPYINAIIKESLRWQNVGPSGVGHLLVQDDVYNGYFIPKGTLVIGNTWSFMHDPAVFHEPLEFIPDRYMKDGKLDPTVRDPRIAAFGFGRRACPGQYFVDQSLWCFISTVLAVFDIQARKDDEGNLINIRPEMTSGLISYPIPFDCNIKPRSPIAEALIREVQE